MISARYIDNFRVTARNNYAKLYRMLVRFQGTSAGAYQDMCAGAGPKDKQDVQIFLAEALDLA